MSATVIGVGNRLRRDDAAGLVVLDRLHALAPRGADLVESDGDAAALLDTWEGAELVVVTEAVRHGAPAGSVVRAVVDPELDTSALGTANGTHDFGLGAAIALGRALGRLPRRLVIVGVEPGDVGHGEGLSPQVAARVPELAALAAEEVRAWRDGDVP